MSYSVQDTPKGRRVDIDGQYKAKDRLEAAKKFAKKLVSHDNATEIDLKRGAEPIPPKSSDWTYYWGVSDLGDGLYYAWFIDFPEA